MTESADFPHEVQVKNEDFVQSLMAFGISNISYLTLVSTQKFWKVESFHVTSQQPNCASHAIHSRHVGSFFVLSGIGKSHRICSHSLLLNLYKAKLHRSNNVINIYSLTASLTCSNKISNKLKLILLFFPGFSYTAPRKKYPTWRRHVVRMGCVPHRENPL